MGMSGFFDLRRYVLYYYLADFCVFYNGSHSGFRNEFQICTEIEMIVQIVR